jgi:toxin ParE1/3/4
MPHVARGVIRRTAQVRQDIIDLYGYIHERSPQAAERVFDAIEASVQALLDTPVVGQLWNAPDLRLQGMRFTTVNRYRNFLVFFRPTSTGVDVFRVIHGTRELERIVDEIDFDFDQP